MSPNRRLLVVALLSAMSSQALAAKATKTEQPALTPTTAATGLPRAPEQEAVTFELADLSFKVDPARKRLDGDAKLTFLANKAVDKLVVDLDRNYKVDLVEVD
ncbi:MAG TPA: M1 family peptidase, partial [Pseudoxanthomonas sp.]|nr:M1 family peptidase [Pseudoxanthomonas sp.]